jgi:hypothetical protein
VQRTVIVAATGALSVALLLGVTGCSPGFSGDDGAQGGGAPATSPVSQPGRHSGLPEPCGTPDQDRLRDLLPGAGSEALKGASRVTYDTGRRAACDWASESEGTVYELSVDFLRTLSYDPEISDNDRAALDFAARADLAAILPEEDTREDDGDGDGDEEPDAGQVVAVHDLNGSLLDVLLLNGHQEGCRGARHAPGCHHHPDCPGTPGCGCSERNVNHGRP